MSKEYLPKHYSSIRERFPQITDALENLGKSVRELGPLDNRTAHLIQLAAAAAIQSEGAVHSHTRRALEAGTSTEEIQHALILLISTIGFPKVGAALSWADDILNL